MRRNISRVQRSSNLYRGDSVKTKRTPQETTRANHATFSTIYSKRDQAPIPQTSKHQIKTRKYPLKQPLSIPSDNEASIPKKKLEQYSSIKFQSSGTTQFNRPNGIPQNIRNPKRPEIYHRNELHLTSSSKTNQIKNETLPHYSNIINSPSTEIQSTEQDLSVIDQSLSNTISISEVHVKSPRTQSSRNSSFNSSLRPNSKSSSSLSSSRQKQIHKNSSTIQSKDMKTSSSNILLNSIKSSQDNISGEVKPRRENSQLHFSKSSPENKLNDKHQIDQELSNLNEIEEKEMKPNLKLNKMFKDPKIILVEQRPPLSDLPKNAAPVSYNFFNKLLQEFQKEFLKMQTNINGQIGEIQRKIALLEFNIAELQK